MEQIINYRDIPTDKRLDILNTEQSERHLPGAIVRRSIAGCQRTMTCKAKVPVSQTSVICWKNTAKSRDGRLWQSIRTMASQVLIWSVLIYREC